ncbi:MAG: DNA translocase FtsK 4TM domain-containing protein [Candidatus Buchananbacteria bacterium]|nr:DNA translocase FtsK 4TM domain-containing protein [Candidatus Buchananbacteria bacterium]
MARKKQRKRLTDLEFTRPRFEVSTETKQSIVAVLLIVLAVISFLSLIDLAGTVGVYFNSFLKSLLGSLRWLAPVLLVLIGYFLSRPKKYELRFANYFGLILIVFSLPALIHVISHNHDLVLAAKSGLGGGWIALVLGYVLFNFTGFWVSLIVLFALLVIGLFLFFDTSFADLSEKTTSLSSWKEKMGDVFLQRRVKKVQQEKEKLFEENGGVPETAEFSTHQIETSDESDDDSSDESDEPDEESKEDDELDAGVKKFKQIQIDLPLSLLTGKTGTPNGGDLEANKAIIKKTLANFGIEALMGEAQVGPTVTQYTLKPAEGVKLSRITGLNDNLALALAAHPIRIEAPIPGRPMVGIEVPNTSKAVVPIKAVLSSEQFIKRSSNLMLALGQDVMGRAWLADLKKMPHLLIAGATGSGKSVMVNTIILSLLFQNGPGDLKFILVDPKRVELPGYNGIPHLLTPVITDVKKTINALRWAVSEMERRFELLSQVNKRNIESYNAEMPEKIPYIVFVIDELADLMSASAAEVEAAIIRLSQMARAVGIHLILATQRPSVDVITGLIKANITSRIAFSVASLVDSRTILDMAGAEKLLGRGDMLYISAELGKPKRIQGTFTSDDEIKAIIDHLKKQAEPEYISEVTEKQQSGSGEFGGNDDDGDSDPLLGEAKEVILQAKKASASLLQRRLRVGYARAARLLDLLEAKGLIGPGDGAKPREVLFTQTADQLDEAVEVEDDQEDDDSQEEFETE